MVQFVSKPVNGIDPASEVTVAKALEQLSDDWHAIHSVPWQGPRGKREGDGEADFLLINKHVGIIVLEVKGGEISIDRGQWKSRRLDNGLVVDIDNPFEQAAAAKSKLYKWIGQRVQFGVPTMHAVVFPGGRAPDNMGPAATSAIVVDIADLRDISAAIGRVVSHWKMPCKLNERQVEQVIALLAPTTAIKRTMADDAYDAEHALIRLTDEQRRAFSGLRRTRRAVVYGGPGTGKTLLAGEKAAQMAADGARVLLVCYNNLLARALQNSKHLAKVEVSTFHSLCMGAAKRSGAEVPNAPSQSWWEVEAPYFLVESAQDELQKYDAIVVDEAQDFSEDWLHALLALLKDEGNSPFYVFADADQKLWRRTWEPRSDWHPYELTINCRNTHPIAEKVANVVSSVIEVPGAKGPEPKWSILKPKADVAGFVCDSVADLLDSGFEARDIVVLCEDAGMAERISQMTAGNASCCRYGGKGVVVETIARFKGLDSAAIVLVLDHANDAPDVPAYIGFSRARSYLQVIGTNDRQAVCNWLNVGT